MEQRVVLSANGGGGCPAKAEWKWEVRRHVLRATAGERDVWEQQARVSAVTTPSRCNLMNPHCLPPPSVSCASQDLTQAPPVSAAEALDSDTSTSQQTL